MEADARLKAIVDDLVADLGRLVVKHRVQEPEFRAAVEYVTELGRNGEVGLWTDAFKLTTIVDELTHGGESRGGTPTNIEGPYYIGGAPELRAPYRLGRMTEPGERLIFTGTVAEAGTSKPIGAGIDVWQASSSGRYDHEDSTQPDFNLRGRLRADAEGRFAFQTVRPAPYEIPKQGAVGRLLKMLGRHAFRPNHIHFKISHDGYRALTTQIYFEGDPWLADDTVGAVKPGLVTGIEKKADPADGRAYRVEAPFSVARFDFRLLPV